MPRIFDNLNQDSKLLPALRDTFALSSRADFCVGYFNLRGWGGLASYVDQWKPDDGPCRVLIGMQRPPHEDLTEALKLGGRVSGHGQPHGSSSSAPVGGATAAATDHRSAHQRRRTDLAPISGAAPFWQGSGQALSTPFSACQAIPPIQG